MKGTLFVISVSILTVVLLFAVIHYAYTEKWIMAGGSTLLITAPVWLLVKGGRKGWW